MKDSPFAYHIRPDRYRKMPWKNGRGTTSEIAIFPENATVADENFIWRLSSAEVNEGGPFSKFPGYMRFLTLAEGAGLKLQFIDSGRSEILEAGKVLTFSGEEAVECQLISSSVLDLGLMVRVGEVNANFDLLELDKKPRSFESQGRTTFFVILSGSVKASVFPGEKIFQINKSETLRIEGDKKLILLEPKNGAAKVAAIEIS